MRFFYNLPRFSEDLDFNTPYMENESFKKILERVEMNLSQDDIELILKAPQYGKKFLLEY